MLNKVFRGLGRALVRDPVLTSLAVALMALVIVALIKRAQASREPYWQIEGRKSEWTDDDHKERVYKRCRDGDNLAILQNDDRLDYLGKYTKELLQGECQRGFAEWQKSRGDKGYESVQCKHGPCTSLSLRASRPCLNQAKVACCDENQKNCRPITDGNTRDRQLEKDKWACKESWATCKTDDKDKCYWNKGKCCTVPWGTGSQCANPTPRAANDPEPAPAVVVSGGKRYGSQPAVLYQHKDKGGQEKTVGMNSNISNIEENTSSVYVPHCTVVDLFQKPNYKGKCIRLWGGNAVYNLSNIPFEDNRPDGECVQINAGQYTTNRCENANNDGCWNDSASSLKVWGTEC